MFSKIKGLLVTLVLVCSVGQVQAGVIYSYDDGTAESSIGAGTGLSSIWLNAFTVVAGGEQINSIDIAFGANINDDSPANGTPMTAYLWTSALNNSNPTVDALVVSSIVSSIQSSHTDTFINFLLPISLQLNIGDVFFAGFQSIGFAVGRDETSSAGQSWIFSNGSAASLDPDTLGALSSSGTFDSFSIPGNALIRVNGTDATVPVPATLALFGLGLAGLGWSRRKKA